VAEEARKLTARVTGRGDDIDATITNARQLSEKLNAASTRIDGVLAKLDGLLGEGGGNDLIAEARDTLVSFRNVADNLNTRIDRISGGLEKFSGRGLDQVEALVQESRRSIQRIERAVADLERNPQRIISGGEGTVRRYDGRARR
jgi:phospholipid/cholesterol/gamma-HCH transport system substrate-binding protein